MAGTGCPVIGRTIRVTRSFVWHVLRAVTLALLLPQQSNCSDSVLILENVDRLRVFNKYQQEATPGDRRSLIPFAPMKIIKTDEILDDGFTRCMRVEVEGEVLYLIKDGDGSLISTGSSGFEKIFNTSLHPDTVQVLSSNAVYFSPIRSASTTLQKGEIVVRLFRQGNLTYCRTVNAPPLFGWIEFSSLKEGRSWSLLKHETVQRALLSSFALPKISARINEANAVLSHLFAFFNSQTQEQKDVPQWRILTSEMTILCTLEQSPATNECEQSTSYLSNEIENILLGSGFQVTHAPGTIEIKPK